MEKKKPIKRACNGLVTKKKIDIVPELRCLERDLIFVVSESLSFFDVDFLTALLLAPVTSSFEVRNEPTFFFFVDFFPLNGR